MKELDLLKNELKHRGHWILNTLLGCAVIVIVAAVTHVGTPVEIGPICLLWSIYAWRLARRQFRIAPVSKDSHTRSEQQT